MIRSSQRLSSSAASVIRQHPEPKWDIFAAVALCRLPVVPPKQNPIQQRFTEMQAEIEQQNSYKSDFELRRAKDEQLLAKKKQLEAEGKDLSLLEGELGVTAMMNEEDWIKKKMAAYETYGISPNSFEDNADKKTLARVFDRKLLLIIRQKFEETGKDYSSPWILPQLKNEGEPLHETAERCLGELFSGDTQVSIYGNAPASHISYKYCKKLSSTIKAETVGGKVFIFKCYLDEQRRDIKLSNKLISDYRWCTADEVSQTLDKQSPYLKQISLLLNE